MSGTSRAWAVIKKVEWPAEGFWGRGKSPAFGETEFKRSSENTKNNSPLLQAFARGLALRVGASLSVGRESVKVLCSDYTSISLKMLLFVKLYPVPRNLQNGLRIPMFQHLSDISPTASYIWKQHKTFGRECGVVTGLENMSP